MTMEALMNVSIIAISTVNYSPLSIHLIGTIINPLDSIQFKDFLV